MKDFSFIKIFLIITTLIFSITESIEAQKISCFTVNPPQKAVNIKKIGIMGFTGDRDARNTLADNMISQLLSETRGIVDSKKGIWGTKTVEGQTFIEGFNTNIYTVIEREQMEKILQEQRLSISGVIDEKTAASVGAILGLDAIIIGNVNYEEKTTSSLKEQFLSDVKMDCRLRTVTTTASMKLIDVSTAEIIGMDNASYYKTDEKCDEEKANLASTTTLLNITLKSIAFRFVNYFSPSYGMVEIELEKIKIKELKKQFEEGVTFFEKGEIDRVYPYFQAIYDIDNYNPSTAYNLGVLYEIVGSYEDALRLYEEAYSLNSNSDTYFNAKKRAEAGLATIQLMESIGKPITRHEFNSPSSNVLAEKITIKGKDSDRIEIHELPENSSAVVAKVPGGLQFQVVEKKGDWYLIKLKNNKEGYIHKNNVN